MLIRHVVGAACAALLAGCASATSPTAADPPSTAVATAVSTTTQSASAVVPTSTPVATTTSAAATHRPTPTPTPRASATAATRGPARCTVPAGVSAAQVLVVVGSGSRGTVTACARTATGYVVALGPFPGHVGRNGVSWHKVEGDGTTPGGVYPLRGGFGIRANPGLRFGGWFGVTHADVWVDDPHSALYNTHQHDPAGGRWTSAENLYVVPAYLYAQVIGYNEARTPGKGSGIFLHVDQGRGTAGCVSVASAALISLLTWEREGAVIAIR